MFSYSFFKVHRVASRNFSANKNGETKFMWTERRYDCSTQTFVVKVDAVTQTVVSKVDAGTQISFSSVDAGTQTYSTQCSVPKKMKNIIAGCADIVYQKKTFFYLGIPLLFSYSYYLFFI